jgi:hypothetical protein
VFRHFHFLHTFQLSLLLLLRHHTHVRASRHRFSRGNFTDAA